MARLGVTYQDIANAANQLVTQGKQPTIELIRQFLGTGSSTTIANHLRQWRADQEGVLSLPNHENVPQEMIGMIKGLWDRLSVQAGQKANEIEAKTQQEISGLRQELEKYKTNNRRWQQLHEQWNKEKARLLLAGKSVENTLFESQKIADNMQVKNNILSIQINEKEKQITEFQKLHQQVQNNLEHYRESMREQRLLEQARFDQQKQEMQYEIKLLKEQLALAKDKALSIQQEYKLLQHIHSQVEEKKSELEVACDNKIMQIAELQVAKVEQEQARHHWEKQFHDVKKLLEVKINQLINSQYENKILLQQLKDFKIKYSDKECV